MMIILTLIHNHTLTHHARTATWSSRTSASRRPPRLPPLEYTVRNPRFGSFRIQSLDILGTDSEFVCYYLSTKGCLGNPTLGTNLGQRILAMRTGCSSLIVIDLIIVIILYIILLSSLVSSLVLLLVSHWYYREGAAAALPLGRPIFKRRSC